MHFLSFSFDASLIPAGESAHKPGTGRRLWGATVSLAACAGDLEFFRDFAAAECAVFPARACDPNLFVRPCGLLFGRLEKGRRVGSFCDGIYCPDEPIAKFLPYPARSGVIYGEVFENVLKILSQTARVKTGSVKYLYLFTNICIK